MRRRLLSLVVLAFSLPMSAQCNPCQASFDDAVFRDGSSMGGPNLLLAIKTVASSALAIERLEVFTGEQTGTNTVAIWSHDAAANKPGAQLGIGAFSMSPNNGWQGANLDQTVNIAAGATFWVAWAPQNGAQSSIRAPGGSQQYRGSFNGGASWNGPFTNNQWKFRIFCCQRNPGTYIPYGDGCPGTSRKQPRLGNVGEPTLNQAFDVTLASAPAQSSAFLVVGVSDQTWLGLTLPFDLAPIGAPGCDVLASHELVLGQTTDGAGNATRTLFVPNDTGLLGALLYNQWLAIDIGANSLNLTVSNGGKGTVGRD